jgi:HK97 family phage major capsid protein
MTEQIRSLRQSRAALVSEAQKLIPTGNAQMSTEVRTKFNKIMTDAEGMLQTINGLETIERENRAAAARGAHNPRPQNGATGENREALRSWMRFGTEMRANPLSTATGSSGLAVLSTTMYPEILEAQKSWGELSTILRPWHTDNGLVVRVPTANDTTNLAGDVTDGAASTEVEPPLTSFLSQVDEFDSGYVLVTVAELEDSNYPLEPFIRDLLMKRIYRSLASKLVTGGTNIQSVITTATNAPTSSSATAVTWADICALIEQVDPAYLPGARFVMNQSTKMLLASVTDSLGRPIYTASPGSDQFDTILGYPITISQAHPNVASGAVGAIQFGNFTQGYTLRDVTDIHLFALRERWLPDFSSFGYLAKARFGGFATNAGTNPVYNLVNHS